MDGGQCWHDNAEFEEAVRKEQMYSTQIGLNNQLLNQMDIIERLPPDTKQLRINHIAHLTIDDEPMTYRVGGYGDGDADASPPIISYLAPLISKLIGKAPGAEVRVELDRKTRMVVLEDIEMPEEPL